MERRRAPRFAVGEVGVLRSLEWQGLLPPCKARVVDVSDSGMRIETEHSVPEGIEVRILMRSGSYLGKVVYCHPNASVFTVGIAAHSSTGSVPRRPPTAGSPPPA